jgi:hypothetical protein
MILYVNGDSNSAGAEAVNPYCFAKDDPLYWALDRQPHPDNLRVSYGCELANMMSAILECDAESASSNDRIVRTTYNHLTGVQGMFNSNKPDLVIIGWSTWEREEWWDPETNRYWQVNAGGIGADWPDKIKARYKDYILNIDMQSSIAKACNKIWTLHTDLQKQNINHLFFNCFEPLSGMPEADWEGCYVEPYNKDFTYYNWLKAKGFKTVNTNSYHFGPDAHYAWAEFLFQTLVHRNLIK